MNEIERPGATDRRAFLKHLAGLGGAALAARYTGVSVAAADEGHGAMAAAWRDQIGLQLYTVRDRFVKDYPGTLLQVARIGYPEVETTLTYGEHTPKQIKEYLDAAGLTAPATHVSPRMGPDFERTLEGYRLIGHRYTTVAFGPPPARPPAARQSAPAAQAPIQITRSMLPASMTDLQTLDSVKRTAEQLNEAGRITKKYGMKVIVHNHTNEFRPLADSPLIEYDVLLAETDPELVAMELDIGWATAAGRNALEMFQKNPGRYEVWHVKDLAGLAALHAIPDQIDRLLAGFTHIVPVGEGEIDYRPIFAQAELAGMKHFFIEQDSAPDSGDSIAAAAESYRNLRGILS